MVVAANWVVSVLPKMRAPAERRTLIAVASSGMVGASAKIGELKRVGMSVQSMRSGQAITNRTLSQKDVLDAERQPVQGSPPINGNLVKLSCLDKDLLWIQVGPGVDLGLTLLCYCEQRRCVAFNGQLARFESGGHVERR